MNNETKIVTAALSSLTAGLAAAYFKKRSMIKKVEKRQEALNQDLTLTIDMLKWISEVGPTLSEEDFQQQYRTRYEFFMLMTRK